MLSQSCLWQPATTLKLNLSPLYIEHQPFYLLRMNQSNTRSLKRNMNTYQIKNLKDCSRIYKRQYQNIHINSSCRSRLNQAFSNKRLINVKEIIDTQFEDVPVTYLSDVQAARIEAPVSITRSTDMLRFLLSQLCVEMNWRVGLHYLALADIYCLWRFWSHFWHRFQHCVCGTYICSTYIFSRA